MFRAKVIVQLESKVDYGIGSLKACFNCERGDDGFYLLRELR